MQTGSVAVMPVATVFVSVSVVRFFFAMAFFPPFSLRANEVSRFSSRLTFVHLCSLWPRGCTWSAKWNAHVPCLQIEKLLRAINRCRSSGLCSHEEHLCMFLTKINLLWFLLNAHFCFLMKYWLAVGLGPLWKRRVFDWTDNTNSVLHTFSLGLFRCLRVVYQTGRKGPVASEFQPSPKGSGFTLWTFDLNCVFILPSRAIIRIRRAHWPLPTQFLGSVWVIPLWPTRQKVRPCLEWIEKLLLCWLVSLHASCL